MLCWKRTFIRVDESLSEKGADPLEARRFHWVFGLAGHGQTPFRIGSEWESEKSLLAQR